MDRETEVLLTCLDQQRNHVTTILQGLTEEQLRRTVLPSAWSCLGMVKHLALADEHYWFRCIVGGEPLDFFPGERNSEWRLAPGEAAEDIFALYRDEIARSNQIIARTPIDAPPGQRDPWWGSWADKYTELRVIMLHVIGETATHAGHLDAAAERSTAASGLCSELDVPRQV